MRKIVFLTVVVLIALTAKAQPFKVEGTNIGLNSRAEQSAGVKLPEVYFESSLTITKKISFWGKVEFSQPIIEKQWVAKGYALKEEYGGNGYGGFSYAWPNLQVMAGVGLDQKKNFWGPTFGIYWQKGNLEFSARGVYSANCAFRKDYSQAEQDAVKKEYTNAEFVYIKGYDPNSWYSATLLVKNIGNFNLGLTSRRFYSTGIIVEYEPYNKSREDHNELKLWGTAGRDLEFGNNSVQLGIMINID